MSPSRKPAADWRGECQEKIRLTIPGRARTRVRGVPVKRIPRKHGHLPDKQEKATQTVLEQAEVLSAGWAA
jgi:type I restriction enzyme R subunit